MKRFRLPYGVSDYLPAECYQKERLEKILSDVFYNAGFEKVRTGALEYYELYDGIVDSGKFNRMFKLSDSDGSLLVLRPDITLQISRMAATKLTGNLQKFYYIENSYEFSPDSATGSARSREFAQVGIEIIGQSSTAGDIETIVLAIESLKASGLTDFEIEIGDINFANGFIAEAGMTESEEAELRRFVNNKDALGTEMLLSKAVMPADIKSALSELNSLYGGKEVLETAKKLPLNPVSKRAVENLKEIMTALELIGYAQFVSVDLGLMKGGYYTGLIIRGLSKNLGVSILDGGRYDNLCKAFGKESEAVGFAIGTQRVLNALELQNKKAAQNPCDIAYISADGAFLTEFEQVSDWRKSGKRVIKLFCDESGLVEFCGQNKIPSAVVFTKTGWTEVPVPEVIL